LVPIYINQQQYPAEFALHQKYAKAERLLDLVWAHCNMVTDIVIDLYRTNPNVYTFPLEVAVQAALLHDVGTYMCGGFDWIPDQPHFDTPYSQHTIVGSWILYQEGYLPEIVQVANVHAGVGIAVDDIITHNLDIPIDNYLPTTQLQQLVSFAAKFHSKTPRFKNSAEIIETLTKSGPHKVGTFNEMVSIFGEPNLEKIGAKYEAWHKAFTYEIGKLTTPIDYTYSSAGLSRVR
jgi:uncharacterized protein